MKSRGILLAGLVVAVLAAGPASASALCFGMAATQTGTGAGELITGTAGNDVIEAGAGADTVDGLGGDDRICGEDGDDTINGQGDDDQLDGGANTTVGDTVTFVGSTGLTANLFDETATHSGGGSDTLTGFENLTGTSSGDTLTGDDLPNVLTGLGGPDGLTGRGGDDFLSDSTDGASLMDEARYPGATGGLAADLDTGGSMGTVSGPGVGTDTLAGVPAVIGTPFPDQLIGSDAQNAFYGFDGDDVIEPLGGMSDYVDGGGGANDTVTYANQPGPVTLDLTDNTPPNVTTPDGTESAFFVENVIGTAAGDTITGDTNGNLFDGRAGDDVLNGGGGVDTASFFGLSQGVNASLLTSSATGQGSDTLNDFDNIDGSSEADILTGDANVNALDGRSGADQITGGGSVDSLSLGSGLDVVTANDGLADVIDCGGAGPDSGTVDTSPAETYLQCDTDADSLVDFLDACPTQAATAADGCPPAVVAPPAITPATSPPATTKTKKKCKKKKRSAASAAKKCKKKKK